MPSRFQNRFVAHAIPALEREFSVNVVLKRKGVQTAEFSARHGLRITQSLGASLGLEIKTTIMKWRLPVEDVTLGGVSTRPQPGDRIVEVISGVEQAEVWEVLHPDNTSQAAKLSHTEYDWETHTQLVCE